MKNICLAAVSESPLTGEAQLEVVGDDRELGPEITENDEFGPAHFEDTAGLVLVESDHDGGYGDRTGRDLQELKGRVRALRSRKRLKTCANDLKRILAMLAKGSSAQRSTQRIVVAGGNRGTEASRIAWGLAVTSAASGFRVLLVDANLNQPAAHLQFGVSNDLGLTDLLLGDESPHRFPQTTHLPNLAVMPAGATHSTYASLLARGRLFRRLQPLARFFDYIIVDAGSLTPSLLARVSDGADNVLVAVRQHVSSMHELSSMVRTLREETVPEPCVLMIE